MTPDEQRRVVMQIKLEVEAVGLAHPEVHRAVVERMPDVLRRAGHLVGLSSDDPWLSGAIAAWEERR